jgi:hypothetical protein
MGMAQAAAALLQQYRTPMQEEAALLLFLFSGSSHQSLETVGPSCLKPIRCPFLLSSAAGWAGCRRVGRESPPLTPAHRGRARVPVADGAAAVCPGLGRR